MDAPHVRRYARLTALLGVLVALLGLLGYWLARDVQRTVLSSEQRELVNPRGEFQASFVLAGRDYDYDAWAGPMVMRGGERVRDYVTKARLGNRTDTIIYVNIVGSHVYMISIPRDIMLRVPPETGLEARRIGINQVYEYPALYGSPERADNLRRAVSELLDLPIDYYAVINIDIFEELVDAVGGVELEVPQRMEYTDQAGGLEIDLEPGLQHLSGEQAAGFVRYRELLRGDIDRIDNIKTLAYALLNRLQTLNVRALAALPALFETYFDEVETNLSPALLSQLLPRLSELRLEAVTLPIRDVVNSKKFVRVVPTEVESFLAELFGGAARPVSETPDLKVMLSNRSGVPGLALWAKEQLVKAGIPAAQIRVRRRGGDPVTRVITTHAGLAAAPFYADLFGVGWQQVDRSALAEPIEIVLGQDAGRFYGVTQFAEGGQPEL